MFDGEEEVVGAAAEVEVGVAPGVEVGAAAQGLAGGVTGGFAGVMDEEEGEGEGTREFAQGAEDGGDLGGVVFVGGLKADVGIENEEAGLAA